MSSRPIACALAAVLLAVQLNLFASDPFEFSTYVIDTISSSAPDLEVYSPFHIRNLFGLKKSDDSYCLIARFVGRLAIRQLGQLQLDMPKGQNEMLEEIPDDADKSGNCAMNKDRTAELNLIWGTSKGGRFILEFYFGTRKALHHIKHTREWEWSLKHVVFRYEPAVAKPNESYVAEMTAHTPIKAPLTQSFHCKHALNITLRSPNNATPVDLTLQFKASMQLQAYDVPGSGGFGNTYLCERSRELGIMEQLKSNTTIAAGCVLGIVTVAVIIGYAVKRQYFPSNQTYSAMS